MDPGINLEMLIVDRHLTIHRHSFGKTDLADGHLSGKVGGTLGSQTFEKETAGNDSLDATSRPNATDLQLR
jgi:hypothetical protein